MLEKPDKKNSQTRDFSGALLFLSRSKKNVYKKFIENEGCQIIVLRVQWLLKKVQ